MLKNKDYNDWFVDDLLLEKGNKWVWDHLLQMVRLDDLIMAAVILPMIFRPCVSSLLKVMPFSFSSLIIRN